MADRRREITAAYPGRFFAQIATTASRDDAEAGRPHVLHEHPQRIVVHPHAGTHEGRPPDGSPGYSRCSAASRFNGRTGMSTSVQHGRSRECQRLRNGWHPCIQRQSAVPFPFWRVRGWPGRQDPRTQFSDGLAPIVESEGLMLP